MLRCVTGTFHIRRAWLANPKADAGAERVDGRAGACAVGSFLLTTALGASKRWSPSSAGRPGRGGSGSGDVALSRRWGCEVMVGVSRVRRVDARGRALFWLSDAWRVGRYPCARVVGADEYVQRTRLCGAGVFAAHPLPHHRRGRTGRVVAEPAIPVHGHRHRVRGVVGVRVVTTRVRAGARRCLWVLVAVRVGVLARARGVAGVRRATRVTRGSETSAARRSVGGAPHGDDRGRS